MESSPIIVLITAPHQESASQIANQLVEKQLAACVNILAGIQSVFRWQGEVQNETEVLLIVKTRRELLQTHLIPAVKAIHSLQDAGDHRLAGPGRIQRLFRLD